MQKPLFFFTLPMNVPPVYQARLGTNLKRKLTPRSGFQFRRAGLISDPTREVYYEGTVTLVESGQALGIWQQVGVRFKGSVGSLGSCGHQPWGSGNDRCNKMSMKLKFNHVYAEQRFFGLKKVMLHASMGDNSQMRERLAYSIFREMGVPTVRQQPIDVHVSTPSSHADGPMGLHLLTENPDGRFTEAFFKGEGKETLCWEKLMLVFHMKEKTIVFQDRLGTTAGAGNGTNS